MMEEEEEEVEDGSVSTSVAAEEDSDQGRKVLPEELSRSAVVLTCESTVGSGVATCTSSARFTFLRNHAEKLKQ